ncbi:40-residue YVTN family beta-propeller repeat-containing protein [Enhydrobacter aerosaccus]|uniref:40-residue YVTN family beta-propeller repeat-containing protein n=1 Tax=Enhydrobacter aerosaccus TaxID=225324 RepID=A0A1T4TK98_9HYPH|nr:YncE family protein [Enhydrobacter aerosaccus]SKA40890.1 40-residue YVTN family beta-propeller repeat-containing protein [Enhydrobacter aerosaccus]
MKKNRLLVLPAVAIAFAGCLAAAQTTVSKTSTPQAIATVPGMPPVVDPSNLYSETVAGKLSPAVQGALPRIYVPNRRGNSVTVIDPQAMQVIDTYKVGRNPQHVVPSWDLKTLWVANNAEGRTDGSLTPIDPLTGKPGPSVPVDDPYNLYWTPDGKYAIVVAEEHKRLDFRDPRTMELAFSIKTPKCGGINHADFSIDGKYALFTCEFNGAVTKIDMVNRTVVGTLVLTPFYQRPDVVAQLAAFEKKPVVVDEGQELGGAVCASRGMPQDVRISPDGKLFYVADMLADGVHVVDGDSFRQVGFIPTSIGAHGLYPSRDGKLLYVANRGSNKMIGPRHGKGSVSVIDFATQKVVAFWPIPGGGSPDMGNVSADGKYLWLSGRFDDVVYRFDTTSGAVDQIKVGREPHGLAVWPQPGRYSLGHTGNLR